MIPSALKSCIFVQAETILIESLSTTSTRHSTTAALPGWAFFEGPLYLMTSFIISKKQNIDIHCHSFYDCFRSTTARIKSNPTKKIDISFSSILSRTDHWTISTHIRNFDQFCEIVNHEVYKFCYLELVCNFFFLFYEKKKNLCKLLKRNLSFKCTFLILSIFLWKPSHSTYFDRQLISKPSLLIFEFSTKNQSGQFSA